MGRRSAQIMSVIMSLELVTGGVFKLYAFATKLIAGRHHCDYFIKLRT